MDAAVVSQPTSHPAIAKVSYLWTYNPGKNWPRVQRMRRICTDFICLICGLTNRTTRWQP